MIAENLLLNIVASVAYDLMKGILKYALETDAFEKATMDTQITFAKKEIELSNDYFEKMLENQKVQAEIEKFKHGEDFVKIKTLTDSLLETEFYFPEKEEREKKAEEIVTYFIQSLKDNLLKNPKTASRFLFSVLRYEFKGQTTLISALRESILNELEQLKSNDEKLLEDTANIKYGIGKLNEDNEYFRKQFAHVINSLSEELKIKLEIANNFFNTEKYSEARKIYVELLKFDDLTPEDKWKLNRNIAMSFLILGEEKKSYDYFKSAYEIYPTEPKGKIQKVYMEYIGGSPGEAINYLDSTFSEEELSDELIILKSNLFLKDNNHNEAIKFLENQNLNKNDIKYQYGYALLKAKRNLDAQKIFSELLEAERKPLYLFDLALSKIEPILEKARKEKYLAANSPEFKKEIFEIKDLLDEAYLGYKEKDNKEIESSILVNRGVIKSLLQDLDGSYEDFILAENIGLKGFELSLNLGLLFLKNKEYGKSIKELTNAYKLKPELSIVFLVKALKLNGQYNKARKLIVEYLKDDQINNDNYDLFLELSEIYDRERNLDESSKIIEEIEKIKPNSVEFILRKNDFLWIQNKQKEAIDYLKDKLSNLIEDKEILEFQLACNYYDLGKWSDALGIFKKLFNPDDYNIVARRYIFCLYALKKDKELIEICTSVIDKANNVDVNEVNEVMANLYFMSNNFLTALPLFKELAISTNKSKYYFYWSISEFRIGNKSEAIKVLDTVVSEYNEDFLNLARISSIYFSFGQKKKGLELAYNAVLGAPDEPEISQNFVGLVFRMSSKDDTKIVTEEQTKLFNKIIEEWENKFPDIKFFEKIEIDPELNSIKERLNLVQESRGEFISLYERRMIPFSIFSKGIGQDIYSLWNNVLDNPSMFLWSFDFARFEEEQTIINATDEVVVEPIALFNLFKNNKEGILRKIFKKVYIVQSTLDLLENEIDELKSFSKSGGGTLYKIGDQLIYEEKSQEKVERQITELTAIINFVKDNLVGNEFFILNEDIVQMSDDATLQTLNFSISRQIPLLCDDFVLAGLFKSKYTNLKYFNSLALMEVALSRGFLNQKELFSIIQEMIANNYFFIPVDSEILLHGISENGFTSDYKNRIAIDSIHQFYNDIKQSTFVVAEFIFKIYFFRNLPPFIRNEWVDYILKSLTINSFEPLKIFQNVKSYLVVFSKTAISKEYIKQKDAEEFMEWFNTIIVIR